jgi:hypothetical protein
MAAANTMSDQQLMQAIGAKPVAPSNTGNANNMSDEELLSAIGATPSQEQTNTPTQLPSSYSSAYLHPVQDKLSIGDNLKLAFADDAGKMTILKDKYKYVTPTPDGQNVMVGDDPLHLQPWKPKSGLENPLGFISRHVSDINQVVQSVAGEALGGAAAGSMFGPAGVVAGGIIGTGLGMASGGITNKAIGYSQGVNQAKNIAEDAAIDTIFGAGFEGASKLLPKAFLPARQKAFNLLNGAILNETDPAKRSAFIEASSKILSLTSGKPQKDIAFLMEHPEFAGAKMGTPEHLASISKYISDTMTNAGDPRRAAVRREFQILKQKVNKGISTAGNFGTGEVGGGLQMDLINLMRDGGSISGAETVNTGNMNMAGNLVKDDRYILNEKALKGPAGAIDRTLLQHFLELSNGSIENLKDSEGKIVGRALRINPDAKISLERLETIQNSLEDKISAEYKASGNAVNTRRYQLFTGGGEIDAPDASRPYQRKSVMGIKDYVSEVADNVGQKTFQPAMDELAKYRKIQDLLGKAGLNLNDSIAAETAIKSTIEGSPQRKELLAQAESMLGLKGDKTFTHVIKGYDVAHAFQDDRVNLFRIGTIMSLIGMGSLRESSGVGKIPSIAMGVTLASPKGVSSLIKGVTNSKAAAIGFGRSPITKMGSRVLMNLLAQQAAKNAKGHAKVPVGQGMK